MSYHSDSVSKALQSLFPNIGLDRTKFIALCNLPFIIILFIYFVIGEKLLICILQAKWHDAGYRRKFFEDYAAENNFDPLVSSNWYTQPIEKILALQVISCYIL